MLLLIKNSTYPCFQTLMHGVRMEIEFPSREKAVLVNTNFHVTKHLLLTSGSITDDTVGLTFCHPL